MSLMYHTLVLMTMCFCNMCDTVFAITDDIVLCEIIINSRVCTFPV